MKKSITLIELMVVVIVLGILALIALPNIKNVKKNAQINVALENRTNTQKAADRYMLDKQTLAALTTPTAGDPSQIDWANVVPKYLRTNPKDTDKMYYWIDFNGTVWSSDKDTATGIVVGADNKTVTWNTVDGVKSYNVGYYEEIASGLKDTIVAGNSYKLLGNVTGTTYTSSTDLSGKIIVVSTISENFESVPVGPKYAGSTSESESDSKDVGQLKVGDYVVYGNYGYPIYWRVIKVADGDVMMITAEPLYGSGYIAKQYDSQQSGINGGHDYYRDNGYGSNDWTQSDIRNWLNLWFNGTTFSDKSYVKDTTHSYLIPTCDKEYATSGTEPHTYNASDPLQNYDTAYKKSVTDKVYLLSVKELIEDVEPLFTKPNSLPYSMHSTSGFEYGYWTRDSYSGDGSSVRMFTYNGSISKEWANDFQYVKVVPAMNLKSAIFTKGTGTQADPYIMQE